MNVLYALPRAGNTGGMRMLTSMYVEEKVFQREDVFFFDTFYSWGESKFIRLLQNFYLKLKFLVVLFSKRIDVVFIMTSSNTGFYDKTVYCALTRLVGRKAVINPVGGQFIEFFQRNALNKFLVPKALKVPNGVVAGTSYWHALFKEHFNISSLADIPNPIRLPKEVKKREKHSSIKNISFLARIDRTKGAQQFARAIKSLAETREDFRVQIAGKGSALNEIQEILKNEVATGVVHFYGFVDEDQKSEILTNSDIYVLPTEFEVLPISILEAMSFNNAIIATKVGGVPDAVREGENGHLITTPDDAKLQVYLNSMLDNWNETLTFGERSREIVMEFEFQFILEKQLAFCRQLN